MKLVQKGNKQLRIPDEQLENYLAKDYCEVDQKTGKLIKKEPVDETKTLKKEVAALKKENAALEKANKELTEKLAALTPEA